MAFQAPCLGARSPLPVIVAPQNHLRPFAATVGEDGFRIEAVARFHAVPRFLRRRAHACFHVPHEEPHAGFVGVAIEEDAQVEKALRVPVAQQHVETLDDDERGGGRDADGTGARVFFRVVKGGENSAAGAAERGQVGAENIGVEGVRRAAPPKSIGVEAGARNVVAVHRNDDGAGHAPGERAREGGLAAAGNASDANHVNFGALF